MPKANFFLVGAAKAGTTSVARFLEAMPNTYFSPIKEPCHFCPDINEATADEFSRQQLLSLEKYMSQEVRQPIHIHHVNKRSDYDSLFEGSDGASIRGEFSTNYLVSTVAAENIRQYNPDAKIMAVLRDPLNRIRSHYMMDWRIGLERRPLTKCIEEEIALGEDATFRNCRMYLAQTDYEKMLDRYRRQFPENQILVVSFEDLIKNQERVLRSILEFLDINADGIDLRLERENSSESIPKFQSLDRMLYRIGAKRALRYTLPRILPEAIKSHFKRVYFGGNEKVTSNIDDDWKLFPEIREMSARYEALEPLALP